LRFLNDDFAIVYIPCGTADDAAALVRALLEENLIACANIYVSRSLYKWDGQLVDEAEHVIFAKTSASAARTVESRVSQFHKYDLPCIITLKPQSVNEPYAAWVDSQVKVSNPAGVAHSGGES
jgi:periplasmic divalent cation tolerance protein